MTKGRLEAFSDGVFAIIITIMVLEVKVPVGSDWSALRPVVPVFLAYVLSFMFLGIYWNNHHHLIQAARHVRASILWANLHLLFWLSLIPVVTHWIGEHYLRPVPVALYGIVMLGAGCAYYVLTRRLVHHHGRASALGTAVGQDTKGRVSLALYAASIPLAYVATWISIGIYFGVAILWLVPDRRIERALEVDAAP